MLVIGIELCFIGLAIDIHYLALTGIETIEYTLKPDNDRYPYNKDENLLHYVRITLGIAGDCFVEILNYEEFVLKCLENIFNLLGKKLDSTNIGLG